MDSAISPERSGRIAVAGFAPTHKRRQAMSCLEASLFAYISVRKNLLFGAPNERHDGPTIRLGGGFPENGGTRDPALCTTECRAFGGTKTLPRPEARGGHAPAEEAAPPRAMAADRSFAGEPRKTTGDMLLRPGLPTEIQAALSTLITRLILEHADKNWISSTAKAGHDLWALLYVRQSLAHQVLHNCESSALQYALSRSA